MVVVDSQGDTLGSLAIMMHFQRSVLEWGFFLSIGNLGRISLSSVQHLQGNVHLCRILEGS